MLWEIHVDSMELIEVFIKAINCKDIRAGDCGSVENEQGK